jgi:MscS family membrane protein
MKEFLETTWYHNTITEWAISLSIILGGVILARLIHWIFKNPIRRLTESTKGGFDDLLVNTIEEPVLMGIVVVGIFWGLERLHLTDSTQLWVNRLYHILIVINVTWFLARFADAMIRQYLAPLAERSDNSLDDHIVPVIRRGIKAAIWALGIVVSLDNAGYDVGAVLAGLGIGGVAMALAAKDFVANIFGGITVYADKPFKIGDRIQVGGYDGTVMDIGLRSTRIHTLAGRLVVVPNFKFTDSFVENVTAEPSRRVDVELGLTYDTSPQKMERAVAILKEIVEANQDILEPDFHATFNKWGDFNLVVTFIYFIRVGNNYFEIQNRINLQILERFNGAGLNFAFPTRTVYTIPS